jgi:group II intron reverse transcriptase/maturase
MTDINTITITSDPRSKGSTGTPGHERSLPSLAEEAHQSQTNLMERIASIANLKLAFKAVRRNKGAPGIDNTTISQIEENLSEHLNALQTSLIDGTFKPMAVKGVSIPKKNGKTRLLGIPTIIDRIVQQAVAQIISPIFDPTFSNSSYGFRPKRSAHDAVKAASSYVKEGRSWVADIDLEQFYDNLNQDRLMSKLAQTIKDKALLKLIRQFLRVGLLQDGLITVRTQGTSQGSPLSPILSNIYLADLDTELERRGHKFCRYADDCNIYVRSKEAADRVMTSISRFIKVRLKLKVNSAKSAAAPVSSRQFLGFRLKTDGTITITKESVGAFKDKVRQITKRNRGINLERLIFELNQVVRGWFHYFKVGEYPTILKELDCWIRRRLRCFRLKQRKRKYAIKSLLSSMDQNQQDSWAIACSRKGWWRKSLNHVVHRAMNLDWFKKSGLFALHEHFVTHKSKTAVCDIARTVV